MTPGAPNGGIADLAILAMTEVNELKRSAEPPSGHDIGLHKTLWRLRFALQQATRDTM